MRLRIAPKASLFLLGALVTVGSAVAAPKPPVAEWNFDWDDNVVTMPTKIWLWDSTHRREVGVSTADFTQVHDLVGKPGKWHDFTYRWDPRTGSLRDFADQPGRGNLFLRNLWQALTEPAPQWQGPRWKAFVDATRTETGAARTTIITARLQSPETIHAGLEELHRRGLIHFVPPVANIFPVSYPHFRPEFQARPNHAAETKARVMEYLLDELEKLPLGADKREVLDRDGVSRARLHVWDFSDDDYGNVSKAIAALSEEVRKHRWPHVKVTIEFTGRNDPKHVPSAVVIRDDGSTRAQKPEEAQEGR